MHCLLKFWKPISNFDIIILAVDFMETICGFEGFKMTSYVAWFWTIHFFKFISIRIRNFVTSPKLRLLSHFPGKITLAAYKLDERRGSVVRISGVNFLYGSWTWWKQKISLQNSRESNWLKVSYQAYKLWYLDFWGFDFVL